MKSDLMSHGVVPKKSLILTFPPLSTVSEDFLPAFVRGYFDGDGCLSLYKTGKWHVALVGTEDFLTAIRQLWVDVLQVNNNKVAQKKDSQIFTFRLGAQKQVREVAEWLYGGAEVYLPRKYEKYKIIVGKK